MAYIGLKHIVAAKGDYTQTPPLYSRGRVIGKAITANINITTATGKLYADNGIAESITKVTGGTVEIGLDDLDYAAQSLLLGHTVNDNVLTASASDFAPYVGTGYYAERIKNGVRSYRAIWLYKVQYGETADNQQTTSDNITFTTPSLSGTIMPLDNGEWKDETIVTTEQAANDWLNQKAGITSAGGGTGGGDTGGGDTDSSNPDDGTDETDPDDDI